MHTPCKYVKLPPGESDAFPVMMKNLSIISQQRSQRDFAKVLRLPLIKLGLHLVESALALCLNRFSSVRALHSK